MKTINAAVRSNGNLAQVLERRRENGFNPGTIKRQSSRQMRQRLNADLRQQVDGMFLEAAEGAKTRRAFDRWSNDLAKLFGQTSHSYQQAVVHATAGARVLREVQVTRKVTVSPFARKKIQVAVVAA